MSLKPPWKQKNPIMEEACQAYHKQTAPTEAVTVVENLEIFYKGRRNEYLEKEIVKTTTWGDDKITVVLFYVKGEEGKITQAVGTITVKGKKESVGVEISKLARASMRVEYKGETMFTLGRGTGKTYNGFKLKT